MVDGHSKHQQHCYNKIITYNIKETVKSLLFYLLKQNNKVFIDTVGQWKQ